MSKPSSSSSGGSSHIRETVYCVGAALFFGAIAYLHQANDPDPEWWMAAYLSGGCLLNILVLCETQRVTYTVALFAMINLGVLVYWILDLSRQIDFSQRSTPRDFAAHIWSLDDGRESGGLLILLLHVLKLRQIVAAAAPSRRRPQKNSLPWSTVVAIAVISGATHIWIMHQSEMNMREYLDHWLGGFRRMFAAEATTSD
jgi:hypothetical protein